VAFELIAAMMFLLVAVEPPLNRQSDEFLNSGVAYFNVTRKYNWDRAQRLRSQADHLEI